MQNFPQPQEFDDIPSPEPVMNGNTRIYAPVFRNVCQGDVFIPVVFRVNADFQSAGVNCFFPDWRRHIQPSVMSMKYALQ